MKVREIKVNKILQFAFDDSNPGLEVNITALLNGDEAMLIDTGFRANAMAVQGWFQERDINVTSVLLTHYHPDHAAGAAVFNGPLYSSDKYYENYKACSEVWDRETEYKKPTQLLSDGDALKFGPFDLEIIGAPGHSACSLMIIINNEIIHVGDLIIKDKTNALTLPYLCPDGSIQAYQECLSKLALAPLKCLLAHGTPMEPGEVNANAHRLTEYLTALKENRDLDLSSWSFSKWHQSNKQKLPL